MILRLLRAGVVKGEEERLLRYIRDTAVGRALRFPGLRSFQPSLRETEAGLELLIVSTWNGFEALTAVGGNLDGPLALPESAEMLEGSHAEHFELVTGEARAMPLREAKLRLARIPIRTGAESAYYEAVRQWSDRLLDQAGMVAFSLGRRVVRRQDEIVAVQVWKDEDALRDAAGAEMDRPMGAAELSRFWAADPTIEHFDAVTATQPRADAPAIFLTDDQRGFVHATPAAEQLSGRSLARLLTMRVEDIARVTDRDAVPESWERFVAEGRMVGPYVLQRPDGTEVEVHFSAKANTPWPGSHASLLVPTGAEGEPGANGDDLDVDAALADAGLVARYAQAGSA